MKHSMLEKAWITAATGLTALWIHGCDASSSADAETVTFAVKDMGRRLNLL